MTPNHPQTQLLRRLRCVKGWFEYDSLTPLSLCPWQVVPFGGIVRKQVSMEEELLGASPEGDNMSLALD